LIQRLAQLEETVAEMRSNQVQKLSFAGLTIDGTGDNGVITAGSGNVADATGLVSTTNFKVHQGGSSTQVTTSSTTPVVLQTLTALTLTRDTIIYFFCNATGYNTDAIDANGAHYMDFDLYIREASSEVASVGVWGTCTTHITVVSGTITGITQNVTDAWVAENGFARLSAGTYTMDIRYYSVGGGTSVLDAYNAGYVIYGT
jgi:hypothetical protein